MSSRIESFKIESYGRIEIDVESRVGRTTHVYHTSPAVIKKLINAKKAPTVSDLEDWVKKEQEDDQGHPIAPDNFWKES